MNTTAGSTAPSEARQATARGLDPKSLGRLIVGIVFLAGSIGYLIMALDMPLGSLDAPGPGAFPVGVGVLTSIVSVVVILESLTRKGPTGQIEVPRGFERKQAIYFFAAFLGFVLVLPYLGQYLASALYVVITLRLLGGLSWIRSIIIGLVMGIGITALFAELLSVPLPTGFW